MKDVPLIPGYKIINIIGKGSVATVYRGIQEYSELEVAIKVLKPSLITDKKVIMWFERESKTAAKLAHSNIIKILDSNNIEKVHYIIMEYLKESLADRMRCISNHKIKPEKALFIVEEIMKGLCYAHLKGIYHRDIKPANIMFKHDDTPVLVDFGIACPYCSSDTMSKTGKISGTIYYMSPEQCKSDRIDDKSDIYSLGVVLYQMLTGKRPYTGKNIKSVALQHIMEPIPKLPKKLSKYQLLINKMMSKKREGRISRESQLIQLIDRIK